MPRNPKPNTANSTASRAWVRPLSEPTPTAPSTERPASITSTVRMMKIPPAVASALAAVVRALERRRREDLAAHHAAGTAP